LSGWFNNGKENNNEKSGNNYKRGVKMEHSRQGFKMAVLQHRPKEVVREGLTFSFKDHKVDLATVPDLIDSGNETSIKAAASEIVTLIKAVGGRLVENT
jgi:hypothetical protein